jgi:hypothetical protein
MASVHEASWCLRPVILTGHVTDAKQAQRGGRGTALLMFDPCARMVWVVSTVPYLLYTQERHIGVHCTGGWLEVCGAVKRKYIHILHSHFTDPLFEQSQIECEIGESSTII